MTFSFDFLFIYLPIRITVYFHQRWTISSVISERNNNLYFFSLLVRNRGTVIFIWWNWRDYWGWPDCFKRWTGTRSTAPWFWPCWCCSSSWWRIGWPVSGSLSLKKRDWETTTIGTSVSFSPTNLSRQNVQSPAKFVWSQALTGDTRMAGKSRKCFSTTYLYFSPLNRISKETPGNLFRIYIMFKYTYPSFQRETCFFFLRSGSVLIKSYIFMCKHFSSNRRKYNSRPFNRGLICLIFSFRVNERMNWFKNRRYNADPTSPATIKSAASQMTS